MIWYDWVLIIFVAFVILLPALYLISKTVSAGICMGIFWAKRFKFGPQFESVNENNKKENEECQEEE